MDWTKNQAHAVAYSRSCVLAVLASFLGRAGHVEIASLHDPDARRPEIDESADPFCFAMIKRKTALLRARNFREPVGLAECALAAPRPSVPMEFR